MDMQHVSLRKTGTTLSSYFNSIRQSHGMRLNRVGQCRRMCCRASSSSSSSSSPKKKTKEKKKTTTTMTGSSREQMRDGYRDAPSLMDDSAKTVSQMGDDRLRSDASSSAGSNTVGTRVTNTPLSAGMKRVLKPLANLRLAIAELASISALSAVGTVIEQNKPAEFYVQQFPEQGNKVLGFLTYKIIFALQLDHIYSANYFLGLLALLGGSLMACTATTQLPMVKVAQRWRFKSSESGYQNLPVARRIQDARLYDVATLLTKKKYQIFMKDGVLYAFKGLGGKLAPIGVHASMIFTMVGIVLGILSGFSGTAMITEGEAAPFSSLLQPSTYFALPPQGSSSLLKVDDFRISYRPDGSVQQFFTDVSVEDEAGRTLMSKTISVNQPLRFGGITAYQTDWSMSALSISLPGSSKEGNIALPMAPLQGVGGSGGKLFGSFLPLEAAPTGDSTPKGISFLAKDLESVVVYDSSGKFVGVRRPTSKKPITVDGVDVVIQDIVASSGMELKSDPGIPLVYAGFGDGQRGDVRAQELDSVDSPSTSRGAGPEEFEMPNYGEPGPLKAVKLPRLEHTCTTCNTSADRCRIRISAWVPQQGSQAIQLERPFPLAIITPGFLISADQYTSYAERLASWGYAVVAYDSVQQALDPSTDLACVDLLEELILWCKTSKPMGMVCDTENVMLIGHSRGAKISTLTAVRDERIKSLCLIDPVDVTVYTPLSNDFPSATDALSHNHRNIPVCIIGGGNGGDCAPSESSFDLYYRSATGPAWQTVVEDAGHLQFLDNRSATAMGLVCQAGRSIADSQVEDVTRSIMVAWAESVMERLKSRLQRMPGI